MRAARHARRIEEALAVMQPGQAHRRRLVRLKQRLRRELERAIRVEALAFRRWCGRHGLSRAESADRLRIAPASLAAWERGWSRDRLAICERGRPPDRADRDARNHIIALFHLMGPGLGVPTLKRLFPAVSRRELEELARRYRFVYRQRKIRCAYTLRWSLAGAVWAIDFTEPPLPIDQQYPYILVVRDLGSGSQLAALPTKEATADVVCGLLQALFVEHGAPLVLKSDNGSPLTAKEVSELLSSWSTMRLVSPPGTPRYNGAVEAGIGGMKIRAHHESARFGRAGQWTCDDVEAARLLANETARPWGLAAPTPDEAWNDRSVIGLPERAELARTVTRLRKEVRRETDLPAQDARARALIERVAITRALIDLGYLQMRRRRIAPVISRRRA